MVKNVFGITLAALLGFGVVAGIQQGVERAQADPIETVDVYGTHNFFTGAGGVFGGNELLKDQVEDDITFTRLTNANGADNCWLGMEKGAMHAGNYIFTATMRMSEGFVDENVGFGFWSNARIKDTVISKQLKANEWRNVEVRFEFNEEEAVNTDSIHMWCLLANGYVDFYNMQFRQLFVGNLGENVIKDVGFENVDLTGGDRFGWNDRHSGKIGCNDNQVMWTKEGENETYNQFLRLRGIGEGNVQFADFCSFLNDWNGSWPVGIPAGEYLVELDVRKNELVDTDNVGFSIYSTTVQPRIEGYFTKQVVAAPVNEWVHLSYRYPSMGVELTEAYASGVDTFQLWFNTKNIEGACLDVDNVSIRKVSLAVDERPEFDGGTYAFQWVEADNADVTIQISNLHGHDDVQILSGEYVLISGEEFTLAGNTLTIKKEFLADFDDGVAEFVIKTSGGERQFTIEVTHIQEDLPDVNDYELEETVFGGDFMDLDVGYRMNNDQTQYAWGAVSNYDDGGLVIAEADGSHALQFKKPEGSTKAYSSSFVIYHPEKIVENTIVTMAFDYKYTGEATDGAVDVCWVGSSNVSYHLIKLNGSKNAKTIEPSAKYREWDIQYSDLANGYTHVEVSLRVDAATVTATNSIRFLMKYNGQQDQELRIQNVSLKKWNKALGTISPTSGAFDKAAPADITLTVKFAEGLSLYAVAADGKTNYVEEKNYSVVNNADGSMTITLKKEYLATLTNGEHRFYVSSSENDAGEYAELEFVLTVSGQATPEPGPVDPGTDPEPQPQPAKKGCGGSIIAASGLISLVALCGFGLLIARKKQDK